MSNSKQRNSKKVLILAVLSFLASSPKILKKNIKKRHEKFSFTLIYVIFLNDKSKHYLLHTNKYII
jgi:hypothetical protein